MTETESLRRGRIGLVVPLRGSESVIGVLEAVGGRPGPGLDRDDERTLASLGDQLGIAVERSRLQERALSLAVVEERNRLARELHDSVTQSLFSITLTIEAARALLHRDLDATERQLVALGERAQEALVEMRGLIHSLRPAGLEDNGLMPALKRIAERMRREHLLTVDVTVGAGARQRPDDEQERELYRIAQEALNNIVKHAAATHVAIELDANDEALFMTIADDGKGFDRRRRTATMPLASSGCTSAPQSSKAPSPSTRSPVMARASASVFHVEHSCPSRWRGSVNPSRMLPVVSPSA